MARKTEEQEFRFPLKGIDLVNPRTRQDTDTAFDLVNVQIHDTLESRARGGIRPGLSKYNSAQVSGTNRIQLLDYATTVANSGPSTTGVGYRTTRIVAVSNGAITMVPSSGAMNAATVSGSRTLSATSPFMLSSELYGRVYITDGISYKIWIASNNTATDWTPTTGSLPGTDGTRVARLITTWGGRLVMAGLPAEPHNYFMSAVGAPLDWDSTPDNPTPASAVVGDEGDLGQLGGVITGLAPFNDDILIMGTDKSLLAMTGNPAQGGGVDVLEEGIGMAFGKAWCMDPNGRLFFFSSQGTIYSLDGPSSAPTPISQNSINPSLASINLNTNFVRMAWNEKQYGFHVFITPFTAGAATHWFFDVRTQGWFKWVHAQNNHNPMSVLQFDGDAPADQKVLIGSEDGYVRLIDSTVSNDDGTAISSFVVLGPMNYGGQPFIIKELQGHLDSNSSSMLYEFGVGDTPELAIANLAGVFTGDGTLAAGRSITVNPRQRAVWAFLKVGHTSSSTPWAFELFRVRNSVVTSAKARRHSEP